MAGVRQGGSLLLYVNGVLQATTAIPAGAACNNVTGRDLRLGAITNNGSTAYFANERLDELRVYSAALIPAQIQADMLSTTAAVPASLVLYLNMDQGTPATASTGANAGLTTLYDLASAQPATLTYFALASGNTSSNYVASYALVVPVATAATSQMSTSFIATWTAPTNGVMNSYVLDVATTADFSQPVTGSPFMAAAPATS